MRRFVICAAAAAVLSISGNAVSAQGVSIMVEPEERTRIREYVVRERVEPIEIEERVVVGRRLPREVRLRPVPETWGPRLARYHYFYSGERVVLVEPDDREVVYIIE